MTMNARRNTRRLIPSALALLCAFAAGWVAAGQSFATSLNPGLAQAFHSVGQNLFGSAVFGVFSPVDPCISCDPIRLDFADNTRLPIALNVFAPPAFSPTDPCRSYLKVELLTDGGPAVIKYDSAFFGADAPALVSTDLSGIRPNTSQCPAPAVDP
jgi:hypothetical protein